MLEFDEDDEQLQSANSLRTGSGIGGDNLSTLLEASPGALFPGGTRIFPSKYHLQRRVWFAALFASGFSVMALIVAIVSGHDSERRSRVTTSFLVMMTIVDGLIGLLIYRWHIQDYAMYLEKVEQGIWLEGVFVFSTGDVVVRFNDLFRKVEMEFDSGTVVEAVGRDSEKLLLICYLDLSGRKLVYKVECDRLVENPSTIAHAINSREHEPYS